MYDFLMLTVQPLVEALIPIVVMFAFAFAVAYAKRKWNIEIKTEYTKSIQEAAINAIYLVEEKAMRDAATGMAKRIKGWKHGAAVDNLLGMIPELNKQEANETVETLVAKLPDVGAFKK